MKKQITPPQRIVLISNHLKAMKKYLITLTALILMLSTTAQTNFLSDLQEQQSYYDSLIIINGSDSMQSTGYVQYQRWVNYWSPKLLPDLDYEDYNIITLNNAENYTQGTNNAQGSKWQLIGPNGNAASPSITMGPGQIHYISKDPHDNSGNSLMASSPTGGLFYSTNDGESWQNAGTDQGLFKCGVSSMVFDSLLYGTWYVTTGNGEEYGTGKTWQNSIGVWRTKDHGSTWANIGLNTYVENTSGDTCLIYNMRKAIQIPSSSNTHLVVATTSGLFLSENATDEYPIWEMLIKGDFYDIEKDLNNSSIIYASGSDTTGIFKVDLSTNVYQRLLFPDTIASIDLDSMEFRNTRRLSIEISPAAPNYLFAIYTQRDNSYSKLFRYNINNQTWVNKGDLPTDYGGFIGYGRTLGWDLMPDTNNNGQLCLIGSNVEPYSMVYNLLDNQDTAKVIDLSIMNHKKPHVDCHYILIDGDDIWAGTDGGVFKGGFYNDTTILWEAKNSGLGVSNMEHIAVDNDGLFLTSGQFDCGSNYYETDDEINWDCIIRRGGDGYQTTINNENDYYLSSQDGGIVQILNGVQNNRYPGSYQSCLPPHVNVSYANFNTYYQNSGSNLYLTGTKNVMKWDGSSWTEWSDFEDISKYPDMGCNKSKTWKIEVFSNNIMYVSTIGNPTDDYYHYHHVFKYMPGPDNDWELIANQPFNSWISGIEINGASSNGSVFISTRNSIYKVTWTNSDVTNATWQNISYNLNEQAVQDINTIQWANYGLFIGTDRGVFHKETNSTVWSKYGNALPNVAVKDIKLANNRIYVGTYGRGLWFASAPTCVNSGIADTITSNSIVNAGATLEFYNDLIIPSGITYTVNGTIKMGSECRIIVQRGAKLIVDGGTITNACPGFWDGIEVWGNANALQDSINQGWVILKNQATIQHAETAIATIKNDNGISDLTYAGGVIQANGALLKNNKQSIVMFPYPKAYALFPILNNESYFKGCSFVYDSNYVFFDDSPVAHISLNEVRGVLFENNVFENSMSSNSIDLTQRGIGISAWNSGFIVRNASETPTGNSFNNLYYGIKAYAYTSSNRLIAIEGNTFNHNSTACYLGAESFSAVNRNIFNETPIDSLINTNMAGLYLDNCTGYQVEENTFFSNYTPGSNNRAVIQVGLVANNSGPEDNFVYNNYFHNLKYATIAQNHNRSDKHEQKGLQYKCNDFENNYSDIAVTWDGPLSNFNGIAEHQGSADTSITAPAGNLFSQNSNGATYSDFDNSSWDIIYHLPHWELIYDFRIRPERFTSSTITLSYNNAVTGWTPTNGCPSNLGNKTREELKTLIADYSLSEEIYIDSLDINVDDGNTTALNLDVVTSTQPETMELRDELLSASPYLSDTVMLNAVEKENVLPNAIITEILTANPQSARAENILTALDERVNPPSTSQMNEIHSNDTIIGNKEKLESKKAHNASEKRNAVNTLSRLYMNDSISTAINDSIATALENINTPASYYQQVFCHYNKGDSTAVEAKLLEITSEFDLSDYQNNQHNGFEDFFEILISLQSQSKNINQIDSVQQMEIEGVLDNSNDLLHAYCRNILIATNNFLYEEPYLFPDTSSTKSSNVINRFPETDLSNGDSYLNIYPNPANEYLVIKYDLSNNKISMIATVTNISGLIIETIKLNSTKNQEIIDLRNYKPGTYLVKLHTGSIVLETKKFIKH